VNVAAGRTHTAGSPSKLRRFAATTRTGHLDLFRLCAHMEIALQTGANRMLRATLAVCPRGYALHLRPDPDKLWPFLEGPAAVVVVNEVAVLNPREEKDSSAA
jgi:hypothetical protein